MVRFSVNVFISACVNWLWFHSNHLKTYHMRIDCAQHVSNACHKSLNSQANSHELKSILYHIENDEVKRLNQLWRFESQSLCYQPTAKTLLSITYHSPICFSPFFFANRTKNRLACKSLIVQHLLIALVHNSNNIYGSFAVQDIS